MRAVVDIGSNSVKFALAENQRDVPKIVLTGSRVTRLSRDLEKTGHLAKESIEATHKALTDFRDTFIKESGASTLQCVVIATSALRDCKNPEAIQKIVWDLFGVELFVASGVQEARLSCEGAAAAGELFFGKQEPLFIEVGGASCQLSVLKPSFWGHSFQVGAVRAHERLGYQRRALSPLEASKLEQDVFQFFEPTMLRELKNRFTTPQPRKVAVAIGGTLVMAAKAAGAQPVNDCGYLLSRERLRTFNQSLCLMTAEERQKKVNLAAGREDIIVSGCAILLSLLEYFSIEEIGFSSWGLRHGALKIWPELFPKIRL